MFDNSIVATHLQAAANYDLSLVGLSLEEVAGLRPRTSHGQMSKEMTSGLNLSRPFDAQLTSHAEWNAHAKRVKEALVQMEASLAAVDEKFTISQ